MSKKEKVKKVARLVLLMEHHDKIKRDMEKLERTVGQPMYSDTLAYIGREIKGLRAELAL